MAYKISSLLKSEIQESPDGFRWFPARYDQMGPFRKLRDAWMVLRGRAEAVIWD